MRIFSAFLVFALIAFPAVLIQNQGKVYAEEDAVLDDEEADVVPEEDAVEDAEVETEEQAVMEEAEEEEEEEDTGPKKSPDALTNILFVKPAGESSNLPGGSLVKVIIGFKNKGESDFIVNTLDASFRYPQDFTYYLQNFTAARLFKTVEPSRQASFEYSFIPSDNFNGRPFGLTINLNYQDKEGNFYEDAVFNETVTITDNDEGFDGETFFMYVTLAALALLVVVILQQTVFSSASRKLTSSRKKAQSTEDNGEIDYDWIPKENLQASQRRTSPRRRTRASGSGSGGSGDESGR